MDKSGLSTQEAEKRLAQYGLNDITATNKRTAYSILLEQFPTFLNGILFIAAIFSFILGDLVDGGFILAIILLNGVFGFIQEYKAEKSLEKLKSYTNTSVRVFRDNKEKEILATQIVPGDIVVLSEGDRVPADGTLVKSYDLEIDEAILTGESLPVRKESTQECFSGTLIVKGKGILEVTTTGNETKFGQIAQTLSSLTSEKTPLQKQLVTLGRMISLIAIAIACILIPFGIFQDLSPQTIFLLVVSIAVAAIPEGLPAVITIALAIGTSRLAKQKAIIRQMPAIETLGAVQIILVDKTGTLTQNSMRVKDATPFKKTSLDHMYLAATLGNTASLIRKGDNSFDIAGDTTDGALLLWAQESMPEIPKRIKDGTILDEFVFDSQSRLVTTIWQEGKTISAFIRGAPESVLERSNLTKKEKEELEEVYSSYAKKGLRVIGFASKTGTSKTKSREDHEQDLTFLGFAALYDPPRLEVAKAIEAARVAGIRTIMVTGDNDLTALSIAKEIGLLTKDEEVITGDELQKLTDDELLTLLPKVTVFARSQPQDKLRIATLLQKQGYIVGVTGDGVNDALALKKANVGIAMGQTGTDVAKEASDIILTDDNFSTLVKAIEEGRAIYRNIVTAILYLLTSNLSEISLVLFSTILGLPPVLLPTQILWINIATDGFPALSLATDPTSHASLKEPPRNPKTPLLTRTRLLRVLGIGLGLALLLVGIYSYLLQIMSPLIARTIIFNGLIFSHLLLAVLIRGKSLKTIPPFLILTIIVTIIVQAVITFVPFFQELFSIGF